MVPSYIPAHTMLSGSLEHIKYPGADFKTGSHILCWYFKMFIRDIKKREQLNMTRRLRNYWNGIGKQTLFQLNPNSKTHFHYFSLESMKFRSNYQILLKIQMLKNGRSLYNEGSGNVTMFCISLFRHVNLPSGEVSNLGFG